MNRTLPSSIGQTPHVDARRSKPARLFGWILALAGVALLLLGVDEARRVVPTLSWPSASGQVDSAWLSTDTAGTRVGRWRNSPVVEPRFHVAYRYRVGAVEYEGRQVDRLPASRRNVKADLRRYPVGGAVAVRYDPGRPTDAVLEARWPFRAALTAAGGLALLIAGRRLTRQRATFRPRTA